MKSSEIQPLAAKQAVKIEQLGLTPASLEAFPKPVFAFTLVDEDDEKEVDSFAQEYLSSSKSW